MAERKQKQVKTPRSFSESKKFANTKQGNKESCAVGRAKDSPSSAAATAASAAGTSDGADGDDATSGLSQEQIAANIAKMKAAGPMRKKSSKSLVGSPVAEEDSVGKKGKESACGTAARRRAGRRSSSTFRRRIPARARVFQGRRWT